jgi:hypothetical protein
MRAVMGAVMLLSRGNDTASYTHLLITRTSTEGSTDRRLAK